MDFCYCCKLLSFIKCFGLKFLEINVVQAILLLMLLCIILYVKSGKCFINVNIVRYFGRFLHGLLSEPNNTRLHSEVQTLWVFLHYNLNLSY